MKKFLFSIVAALTLSSSFALNTEAGRAAMNMHTRYIHDIGGDSVVVVTFPQDAWTYDITIWHDNAGTDTIRFVFFPTYGPQKDDSVFMTTSFSSGSVSHQTDTYYPFNGPRISGLRVWTPATANNSSILVRAFY